MLSVTAAFYSEKTEQVMKKIATTALVLGLTATTAFAGGYVAPVVETPVVVQESAASSAAGWVVPALLVLGIAAALASDDSN